MTAIIKGSTSVSEIIKITTYQDWAIDNIPYVEANRDEGGPGVDLYQLTFGFRKIHIGDLAGGRYKFVLQESDDDFVKIHREAGGDISGFMMWPSPEAKPSPYVKLTYVVENNDDRKAIETFLDDYLDHCDDAESKFERACFDTNSNWAKKQCWYNLVSKPQLIVIHEMDHTLGKFKKPWLDTTEKEERFTLVGPRKREEKVWRV